MNLPPIPVASNDERSRIPVTMRGPGGRPIKIDKVKHPRRALMRLIPYMKPYTWPLAAVLGMVIVYTLLGLVGPYLIGLAIDRFVITRNLSGLMQIALWMLGAYLFNNFFTWTANWQMAWISQGALKSLRSDLFQHLQSLPLSFFDRHSAGELMSRLTNDIDAINQAISQNVTALLGSVLSPVGIVIAMFVLNHWLALTTLLIVPVMIGFGNFIATYTRRGFRELQKQLGGLNSVEEEAISGDKVIKAFRRNESILATFREKNQAVYKAGVYANTYAMMLMPLTNVMGNFFVILVAAWAAGWLCKAW